MAARISVLALTIFIFALAGPAQAYVGPGAGVSLLGAAFGLIFAVALALGVIVLWPLRRLFKHRKAARQNSPATETAQANAEPD